MYVTDFSVRRPVAITMIVLVFVVMGFISLRRMPVEFFPEIEFPVVFLSAPYEGVGPEEIEKLVTRPLEMAVSRVSGVTKVTSTSQGGLSTIQMEFEWGTDLDQAMADARSYIEVYKNEFLPEEMGNPMMFKWDPSSIPVSVYTLASPKRTMRELRKMAEDIVQPYLEKIEGVGSVLVWGGGFREISVLVDQKRLAGVGLSLGQVVERLRAENLDVSSGHVVEGGRDFQVKSVGEFESLGDVRSVVLTVASGHTVRLGDVGQVLYAPVDETAFARVQGQSSTVVAIMKQTDANTVAVSAKVRKKLSEVGALLPGDVVVSEMFDSAEYIEASVNNVRDAAIYGAILAVLVLFLFLKSYRAALVIGTAIPLSIIFTFFPLYFMGISVNMISLGGLAIGIGMLVDNSIVVLENIFRRLTHGDDRFVAARTGAAQVAVAITASTLTTVIIFVPILFTRGIVRILFGQLALSVTFSLLASLMVALTLIPMLGSKVLNRSETERIARGRNLLDPVRTRYLRILEWALRHRLKTLLVAGVLLGGSLLLIPVIGANFLPDSDDGIFQVMITLPTGSPLERTKGLLQRIESHVMGLPYSEVIFSMGGETGDPGMDQGPNAGYLMVRLVDKDRRSVTTNQAMNLLRDRLKEIGGAKFRVASMSEYGGSQYGDIEIKVSGKDFGVLESLASDIQARLAGIPGIRETTSSVDEAYPEIRWVVDRQRAAGLGLGALQIGNDIRTALQGQVATRIEKYGTEIDVRVRLREDQRDEIEKLGNLILTSPLGFRVPLRQVATLTEGSAPGKLYRENQMSAVWVGGSIGGRDLRGTMVDVRREMARIPLPEGYVIAYGGEDEQMRESMRDLMIDFALAALLVYMVMAALFESFAHPFTIMFSVPFAVTGALLALFVGHLVSGMTITVNAMIGIVMLVGIVVNNAIVLLDYVQRRRMEGLGRAEALVEGGGVRLRPILLTALTTILGLAPLALGFGEGTEVRAPMATAVIGGLAVSTLLTLVIIPVIYTYVDSLSARLASGTKRLLHREEAAG